MNNEFVNFDDYEEEDIETILEVLPYKEEEKYEYDNITTEYYKVLRERKLNVFLPEFDEFDYTKSFRYSKKWNVYSGIPGENDPYGPLCFFPDDLIHYFYSRRLEMLWHNEVDEAGGFYEGYYGSAVGAGENIVIKGRGEYPEKYLFRLPVINCYIPKSHHLATITMGPKLTHDEIVEIETLATTYYPNYYKETYKRKRPSLIEMKLLYDEAISENPTIVQSKEYDIQNLKDIANREAVQKLIIL